MMYIVSHMQAQCFKSAHATDCYTVRKTEVVQLNAVWSQMHQNENKAPVGSVASASTPELTG